MFIKASVFRKPEPEKMNLAIDNWLKGNALEAKFLETKVLGNWAEIVGPTVARHTRKVFINKKVLTIYVTNAPLRQQLTLSRTRLVQLVNEQAGSQIVTECLVL